MPLGGGKPGRHSGGSEGLRDNPFTPTGKAQEAIPACAPVPGLMQEGGLGARGKQNPPVEGPATIFKAPTY